MEFVHDHLLPEYANLHPEEIATEFRRGGEAALTMVRYIRAYKEIFPPDVAQAGDAFLN